MAIPPDLSDDSLRKLVEELVSRDHVLLYSDTGQPILKNSDLWTAAEAEWRKAVAAFLKDYLSRLQPGIQYSPEELVTRLKAFGDPKYTLDIVDGQLSLPISFTYGTFRLRGHLPLYGIATAAIGIWYVSSPAKDRPEREQHGNMPPSTQGKRTEEHPFWDTITVGTFRDKQALVSALHNTNVEVTPTAERLLTQVRLVQSPMKVGLVVASPKQLGLRDGDVQYVIECASEQNLFILPDEAAAQVCLQLKSLPSGTQLQVAMDYVWCGHPPCFQFFAVQTGPLGAPKSLEAVEFSIYDMFHATQAILWCTDVRWTEKAKRSGPRRWGDAEE